MLLKLGSIIRNLTKININIIVSILKLALPKRMQPFILYVPYTGMHKSMFFNEL